MQAIAKRCFWRGRDTFPCKANDQKQTYHRQDVRFGEATMEERPTVQEEGTPQSGHVEQPARKPDIVVQTLGGFEVRSLTEPEEAERTALGALVYLFAVVSPTQEFGCVRVETPAALQDETRRAVGPRFKDDPSFWRALAEDALTIALDEQGDIPSSVIVERLTLSQLDMARRWKEWDDIMKWGVVQ